MGDDEVADGIAVDTAERSGADHLPIGEVLALLQSEFPDVTISKIRFLESQGLIQPERTASGYRRFSSDDIERLRWILHQQRENFLPLKVIRKMLDAGVDHQDPPGASQQTLFSSSVRDAAEAALVAEGLDDAGVRGDAPDDTWDATSPERPPRSPAHPAVASAPPAGPSSRPHPAPRVSSAAADSESIPATTSGEDAGGAAS
ncbi:MAG: MerR family transcriptional regulator, partial [Actinobacteria bacterium]|nr:MerR family transcriptional regulator [Actinomycetota bacterium]